MRVGAIGLPATGAVDETVDVNGCVPMAFQPFVAFVALSFQITSGPSALMRKQRAAEAVAFGE